MDQHGQHSFELLDEPEEPSSGAPLWSGRLDLLLGLTILLAVAAMAGWQWWNDESRWASYRAGKEYAQEHNWEAARSAYLAAGGYGDAEQRLADVERIIGERDESYENAVREAQQGEWAAALRDLRTVREIQPGFRDSWDLLSAAERQVQTLALSGTVALRPSAWPPGLYWYTADGWTWLVGSDPSSTVRGSGEPCCVVYDVPAPGGTEVLPQPAAGGSEPPVPAAEDASAPAGRRLMVARNLGDSIVFKPLELDPAAFDWLVWDEHGTTTFRNKRQTQRIADARLGRVSILYPGLQLAYQPYSSSVSMPLHVPGAPWALLALMPDGRTQVLGDYTRATGDAPETSLYLSFGFAQDDISSYGGDRLLLAVRPAVVQSVFPSPDNRYLLIDEFSPLPGGDEEHRLVVLALDRMGYGERVPLGEAGQVAGDSSTRRSETPPSPTTHRPSPVLSPVVIAAKAKFAQPSYLDTNWYSVSFVSSGRYAGTALIRGNPMRDSELRLIDPAHAEQPIWAGQPPPGVSRFVAIPIEAGLLIALFGWEGADMGALYVDAEGRSTNLNLATPPVQFLGEAWQRGDRLVYSIAGGGRYNRTVGYSIRSLTLAGLDTSPASALVLYQDGYQGGLQSAGYTGHAERYWAVGTGLLAYIQDGSLHAKTYDGSVDLQLEDDVRALYVPHSR